MEERLCNKERLAFSSSEKGKGSLQNACIVIASNVFLLLFVEKHLLGSPEDRIINPNFDRKTRFDFRLRIITEIWKWKGKRWNVEKFCDENAQDKDGQQQTATDREKNMEWDSFFR